MRTTFFLMAFFTSWCFYGSAQVEMVNDGQLFISDNQLVHVNGNFTNFSSDFINRGIFGLTGHLTNEARVFNPGAGILRMYGISEQNLFLYQAFGTYDFEINNLEGATMMGTSSLQLFNHLYFEEGIIRTNRFSLIAFEPLATHSFSSDFSHIDGPMRRLGMTDFTFPVGKGGLLRAPSISGLTSLTKFHVEYFNQGHVNLQTDATLARVNDQEYWEIRQVEGISTGRITIPYDETTGQFPDLQRLELAFLNTDNWTKIDAQSDGATPMMELTSTDLLNQFKFFTTAENRKVRDRIIIDAEQNEDCEITVNWIVPPGFTTEKFEVERSFDSLSFLKLGEVEGDPIASLDYKLQWFLDPSLYKEEIVFYRLKIFYEDGTFGYSNIASIDNNCVFEDCILFPNPVSTNENISIRLESDSEKIWPVQVWTTLGRLLMTYDLNVEEGRQDYVIPTRELKLPAATYYLSIGPRKSLKFVVINDR